MRVPVSSSTNWDYKVLLLFIFSTSIKKELVILLIFPQWNFESPLAVFRWATGGQSKLTFCGEKLFEVIWSFISAERLIFGRMIGEFEKSPSLCLHLKLLQAWLSSLNYRKMEIIIAQLQHSFNCSLHAHEHVPVAWVSLWIEPVGWTLHIAIVWHQQIA